MGKSSNWTDRQAHPIVARVRPLRVIWTIAAGDGDDAVCALRALRHGAERCLSRHRSPDRKGRRSVDKSARRDTGFPVCPCRTDRGSTPLTGPRRSPGIGPSSRNGNRHTSRDYRPSCNMGSRSRHAPVQAMQAKVQTALETQTAHRNTDAASGRIAFHGLAVAMRSIGLPAINPAPLALRSVGIGRCVGCVKWIACAI